MPIGYVELDSRHGSEELDIDSDGTADIPGNKEHGSGRIMKGVLAPLRECLRCDKSGSKHHRTGRVT